MSGKNIKGRSKAGPPFICLRHYVYESAAYRSLTPADRCVYMAIQYRYNGSNNGRIVMSVRQAVIEAGVNKDTVTASIKRLLDRGLVEIASESNFETRVAREYRLTHERCDRTNALPSKAFLKWKPAEAKPADRHRAANDVTPIRRPKAA